MIFPNPGEEGIYPFICIPLNEFPFLRIDHIVKVGNLFGTNVIR